MKYERTDLMDRWEVLRRAKYYDGAALTLQLALELSIEKWERLRLKDNWQALKNNSSSYMHAGTCALCLKYHKSSTCNGCPLVDGYVDEDPSYAFGCCDESQWRKAKLAVNAHDRKEFLKAARNIIRRMRRALERSERCTQQ